LFIAAGKTCLTAIRDGTQTLYSNVKLTAERDAATGDLVWKSKDNTTLVGGLSDEHYYLYYPY
jgi:hypothetical protein